MLFVLRIIVFANFANKNQKTEIYFFTFWVSCVIILRVPVSQPPDSPAAA